MPGPMQMYFGRDSPAGKAEEEQRVVFTEHTAGGRKSTNTPGVWCTTELFLGFYIQEMAECCEPSGKKNSIVFVQ